VVPTELEALLLSHQDVADAGVVGIPDADANELPAAFVVRRDGSSVNENQLQTFVSGNHRAVSVNQSVSIFIVVYLVLGLQAAWQTQHSMNHL